MKTKNCDEYDAHQSLFAVASCRRHHPFSKTNPFADISNGVVTTLFGGTLTNMNNPGELIFDAGGRLYISDFGSNRVFATSSATAPTNLLSMAGAYEMAFDASNRLAVGSRSVGGLQLYSTSGQFLASSAAIKPGASVAAGPGDSFWGRELYSVSTSDQLIRIDTFGNAVVVGTGFDGVLSLAFGPDNALYVSYRDYDVILRIAPVATPAPDHWWRADGNASNAVSNAHGTASASVTYAPGRIGQAFSFDGTFASQVTFGTNAGNFGTGDFTIGLWLKTATSNTLNTQFLVKRAGCSHENFWSLAMAGGPYIELDQDNQANNYFSVSGNLSAAPVADAQWHHLAFVRRGGEGLFYRDAVLVGAKATNFVTQLSNTALLLANSGICQAFGAAPLTGLLDEIKLYGCALSASQIAESAGLPDPSRPTLNIARLTGAVQLSWTTNATGYVLETNATLPFPAGWGVLTSNYSVLVTNYVVTNVIGSSERFYRLRKP